MENLPKKPNKTYIFETTKVIAVAFEMGFIIALPIVVLGYAGKKMDEHYHTGIFVYIAIVLALASSVLWLYKRFSELLNKLNQAAKHKDTNNE